MVGAYVLYSLSPIQIEWNECSGFWITLLEFLFLSDTLIVGVLEDTVRYCICRRQIFCGVET